jgi:hypothetical protein
MHTEFWWGKHTHIRKRITWQILAMTQRETTVGTGQNSLADCLKTSVALALNVYRTVHV